jgi:hypothetical protein
LVWVHMCSHFVLSAEIYDKDIISSRYGLQVIFFLSSFATFLLFFSLPSLFMLV